jgi:hypothetical protein
MKLVRNLSFVCLLAAWLAFGTTRVWADNPYGCANDCGSGSFCCLVAGDCNGYCGWCALGSGEGGGGCDFWDGPDHYYGTWCQCEMPA